METLIRWIAEDANPVRRTFRGPDGIAIPGYERTTGIAGALVCDDVRDAEHLAELVSSVEGGGLLALGSASVDDMQDAGLRIVAKHRTESGVLWLCRK